jgi:hypothetical protein
MGINKGYFIGLIGGRQRAAKLLGIAPGSLSNWPTDEDGNLTSRAHEHALLGAIVRLRVLKLRELGKPPQDEIEKALYAGLES